jgi:hypothetical protein
MLNFFVANHCSGHYKMFRAKKKNQILKMFLSPKKFNAEKWQSPKTPKHGKN